MEERGCKDASAKEGKKLEFLEIGKTQLPLGHSVTVDDTLKKPKIFTPEQSPLLNRLQQFLPELAASNEKVNAEIQNNPDAGEKYDIECAQEDEKVIEMNVSLVPLENEQDEENLDNIEKKLLSNAKEAAKS
mmetsp:Transcript_6871/g.7902  ORF Transcript_6871/g.7902 Transcript_6871/m.7902 type:complete len:132 (-) Transcript_6871:470-865(-)